MGEIARWWPEGPDRQRLEAAVARFRIPYWDWASQPPPGQSILPMDITGQSKIWANGPNGFQSIDNPLYTYVFKPLNVTAFGMHPVSVISTTFVVMSTLILICAVGRMAGNVQEPNDQRYPRAFG